MCGQERAGHVHESQCEDDHLWRMPMTDSEADSVYAHSNCEVAARREIAKPGVRMTSGPRMFLAADPKLTYDVKLQ